MDLFHTLAGCKELLHEFLRVSILVLSLLLRHIRMRPRHHIQLAHQDLHPLLITAHFLGV